MPFSATRDLWLVLKARDEATRAMRSFAKDVRMVGDSVQQANLQAARSALRNQLAMQRMTGATKQDQIATMQRIEAIDKEINQSKIHRASMEESRVSAQKLSSALGGAAATMTAVGTGMVAAGVLGVAGLKSLINSAEEYQKQSSLTRTQVDHFSASLRTIEDIGIRVANTVGVSFDQIQPALFNIFSSMEIGTKDAEKFLTIFAKAAVAGQTSIQSAATATIGIMNAFQLPLTSINHLMDLQFQLVKEGVGTYDEWTQRIGLVSPSAVRAGQSIETMLAALAATTRMGISAARSGTAVARAMDAMSNPNAVKAMKALGVNAQDASGKFRPMIDVLGELRTALDKVPQKDKIATILDIFKGAGGTIEARRFLQNMLLTPGNLELFKQIFDTMSKESGSFEQAYATMADTAATKSQLLANQWETLRINAGEALIPVFLKIVSGLSQIFTWFNKLSPGTQRLITLVAAFSLVLIGVGGILLIVLGTLAAFVAAAVVAGSALFIVVGVLAGVAAGFTILSVMIGIAWAKSAEFRGMISDLGKSLSDLYHNYIIPTGIAIRDAWEKYMSPALTKLADLVEHRVMPAIRDFQAFMLSETGKSIKEVGNNIKDFLIWAFHEAANVINTIVIPAVQKLTQFYEDHKETIKQVVGWLIWLAKWGIKIGLVLGGILAVILVGPVVAAFLAVVAAIVAVIAIITYLVEAAKWIIHWFGTEVPKAWNWLVDHAKSIWNSISSFFENLWNDIVGFFVGAWNKIVGVFNTFMNGIKAVWNVFWNSSIGGLIKAVFGFIVALVQLGIAAIEFVFLWGLKIIETAWNATWNAVKGVIMAIWNWISPYLEEGWNRILLVARTVWGIISNFFIGLWNTIKDIFIHAWFMIESYIMSKWISIKNTAQAIWGAITGIIGGKVDEAQNKVTSVWDKIKNFFSGAGSWLWDAGRNIVQGLIDGISSMINKVTGIIDNITKTIKDHFPHSPAKRGPLAGRGGMFFAGQNIINQLNQGMTSKLNLVNSATALVANATNSLTPSITGATATGNTINQNITINTQELNPRRQAAELGWLLAGRAG